MIKEDEKVEEKSEGKPEEVTRKIDESSKWAWWSVWVDVSGPVNVREIVVKDVKLVHLGCSIRLSLGEGGIIAKESPVPIDTLA